MHNQVIVVIIYLTAQLHHVQGGKKTLDDALVPSGVLGWTHREAVLAFCPFKISCSFMDSPKIINSQVLV